MLITNKVQISAATIKRLDNNSNTYSNFKAQLNVPFQHEAIPDF